VGPHDRQVIAIDSDALQHPIPGDVAERLARRARRQAFGREQRAVQRLLGFETQGRQRGGRKTARRGHDRVQLAELIRIGIRHRAA
jgi:hypothetical protein